MDELVKSVTSEIFAEFPQVSREALRETITNNLAAILVEQQLQHLRQAAIEAVRAAILPTVDAAIDEALATAESEDDTAWAHWQKVLGETPLEN
jgi:hypothetical protein